jgi:hypothetical protein
MVVKNGTIYFKGGAVVAALIVSQFNKVEFVKHFAAQLRGKENDNVKMLSDVYEMALKLTKNDNDSREGKVIPGTGCKGNNSRKAKKG